ncbi:uncharacterized protein LOC100821377 [Brachypodium distachyon]|uniref:DUF6598 domain-containing protein n=1 Tax=Brachypodium distachyon TaxID=15368 RepID=I1GRG3_BRADI|nr:uncharacterized protein LOC100821377 [Brachypodium distachyon]KQK14806.1 hypothetical protein BRADI_1g18700v3 [Brachypodium distachyon]|eukprot:XP_003562506.2 uncharacterized protein LOC100821377 [Brachypodium distachyon]
MEAEGGQGDDGEVNQKGGEAVKPLPHQRLVSQPTKSKKSKKKVWKASQREDEQGREVKPDRGGGAVLPKVKDNLLKKEIKKLEMEMKVADTLEDKVVLVQIERRLNLLNMVMEKLNMGMDVMSICKDKVDLLMTEIEKLHMGIEVPATLEDKAVQNEWGRNLLMMDIEKLSMQMEAAATLEDKAVQTEPGLNLEKAMEPVAGGEPKLKVKEVKTEPGQTLEEKAMEPAADAEPELKVKAVRTESGLTLEEKAMEPAADAEPELKVKAVQTEPGLTLEKKATEPVADAEPELKVKAVQTEPGLTLEEKAMEPVADAEPELKVKAVQTEPGLTLEEKAMEPVADAEPELKVKAEKKDPVLPLKFLLFIKGLHIVACRDFTEYDPRRRGWICTRFCDFNIAFFDMDAESDIIRGPPLNEVTDSQRHSIPSSSVNFISLKIIQSDDPFPVGVFGTVLARDEVDFKCVYLFRREREDSQHISSVGDMLALTGPCRALCLSGGRLYFEINLKIKGADITDDRDFSKGVIIHSEVPFAMQPTTKLLSSWRSTVELVLSPIPFPVAATIEVNILNGPRGVPFNGKITAWTTGNADNHIILYEYDDSKEAGACVVEDSGSVVLSCNLVAVPLPICLSDEVDEIVLNICFFTDDGAGRTSVALEYPEEEKVCHHGSSELQVKVAWTAIFIKPVSDEIMKRRSAEPKNSFKLY